METRERAERYLSKLPPAVAGSGGHDSTFKAACVLVKGFALDHGTAHSILSAWNQTHCSPPWSDAELLHKIKSAEAKGGDVGYLLGCDPTKPKSEIFPSSRPVVREWRWPALNVTKLGLVVNQHGGMSELFESSPMKNDPSASPYFYLERLFPAESLLCLGKDIRKPIVRPIERFRNVCGSYAFIVPNPMTASTGRNLEGRKSVRCLDNTGRRRYLVVECDFEANDKKGEARPEARLLKHFSPGDICAAVLLHLANFAPLVMAVNSGGKSVHGWFAVNGQTDETLKDFMRYAVMIGGDHATWVPCQFVRLPNGKRENGRVQSVLFFNPELII